MAKYTEAQKEQALENARESQAARIRYDEKYQPRGFSKWGNDKCISRTGQTIRDIKNDVASDRQIAYWLNH